MAYVLVLEDDELQQRLLCDVLEDEGHEVCLASSIDACLAHCSEHEHDLLVTDLLVQGDFAPLARLRRMSPAVLVLSGHPELSRLAREAQVETPEAL